MPTLPMTATPSEMPRSLTVVANPDAPPALFGGTELTTRSVVSAIEGATPGYVITKLAITKARPVPASSWVNSM